MSEKKIITVFGATGNQGGAVVETFLNDPKLKDDWLVRGITRDVTKDSAKNLSAKGVEVVAADLDDKASLVAALQGSYAVFAVTNYWEKMDMDLEIQQGKNIANAANETNIKLLIWSALYNVTEHSKGVLSHLYHFDSKAIVKDYIRELGIPATFFMPGFYMPNLPGKMFKPSPPDNAWTLGLPVPSTSIIPMYLPSDTGKYIKAAVLNEDKVLGRHILGATAYMTGQEVVDGFKRVFPESGKDARWFEVPAEVFRGYLKSQGSPDFVVDELHENMRILNEFGYYFGESLDFTHSLVEDKLTTWEEYIKSAPGFKDAH